MLVPDAGIEGKLLNHGGRKGIGIPCQHPHWEGQHSCKHANRMESECHESRILTIGTVPRLLLVIVSRLDCQMLIAIGGEKPAK